MYKILDICFDGKIKIDFKEFSKINEEIASDMLLSVLNLFRQKLPCSENFWRYKRNYELHMQSVEKDESKSGTSASKNKMTSPGSNKNGVP